MKERGKAVAVIPSDGLDCDSVSFLLKELASHSTVERHLYCGGLTRVYKELADGRTLLSHAEGEP